jgi:hypothetical protein
MQERNRGEPHPRAPRMTGSPPVLLARITVVKIFVKPLLGLIIERDLARPLRSMSPSGSVAIPARDKEAAMYEHCHSPPERSGEMTGRMGAPCDR